MACEKSVMAVIRASRPSFRNKRDKIAFAIHATYLASGYVLTSTGPPAFSVSALFSSSSDEVGIEHWNELDDDYAFVYVNPETGSKKLLVMYLMMNDKLHVHALAAVGSEPVHLEINVGDYVEENPGNNYSGQYKNLEKLVKSLGTEILSKLDGSSSTGSLSDKLSRLNPNRATSKKTKASEKSVMAVIRASRPSFRNKHDKIAFAIHATFLASGYVLTTTRPPDFSLSALSSSSSDEVGIEHWNELDNYYAFLYVNPVRGSKKVLVRCNVKNDKLIVDALAKGGWDLVHLEINVADYVEENPGNNYSGQYKNLEKLVKSLEMDILSKLDSSSSTGSLSYEPSSSRAREGSRRNQRACLAFLKCLGLWRTCGEVVEEFGNRDFV